MLRVEFHDAANALTMQMEGRLAGTFAEETRALVMRCKVPRTLVVDLSEVTFVDSIGEELLAWLGRIGGEFIAESSYSLDVCERLHLPVKRKHMNCSPARGSRTCASQAKSARTGDAGNREK